MGASFTAIWRDSRSRAGCSRLTLAVIQVVGIVGPPLDCVSETETNRMAAKFTHLAPAEKSIAQANS